MCRNIGIGTNRKRGKQDYMMTSNKQILSIIELVMLLLSERIKPDLEQQGGWPGFVWQA